MYIYVPMTEYSTIEQTAEISNLSEAFADTNKTYAQLFHLITFMFSIIQFIVHMCIYIYRGGKTVYLITYKLIKLNLPYITNSVFMSIKIARQSIENLLQIILPISIKYYERWNT